MDEFIFIAYCVLHGAAFLIIGYISIVLYKSKNKPRNKVHFYVARDECGSIFLYLGKPERRSSCFFGFCGTCATLMVNEHYFKDFGLNPDDFKDLKWEDEPVEVFLNLED